jgi:hypothetical protein
MCNTVDNTEWVDGGGKCFTSAISVVCWGLNPDTNCRCTRETAMIVDVGHPIFFCKTKGGETPEH